MNYSKQQTKAISKQLFEKMQSAEWTSAWEFIDVRGAKVNVNYIDEESKRSLLEVILTRPHTMQFELLICIMKTRGISEPLCVSKQMLANTTLSGENLGKLGFITAHLADAHSNLLPLEE